ncbi:MAG: ABC transporter ATP-binding protein [Clostridia bacterium]|nr:ABC transporter ATP-binding protein [Clostridia bacterium]
MWKYIKKYIPHALLAVLFMGLEVTMDLKQPSIMSRIVDEGVLGVNNGGVSDLEIIWKLGLTMIGLVLFGGVCGSMNNLTVSYAGQNIGNNIRKDCFRGIMGFSFPQMDKFGTGSLVTRITNDVTQVQSFFSMCVRGFVRTGLLTAGSIYYMFSINRTFGLIVLCAFPPVLGWVFFSIARANPLFTRLQEKLDRLNSILQEDVSGIRVIKAYVREAYEKIRFGKANDDLLKTNWSVMLIFAFMNPVTHTVLYLIIAVILRVGAVKVAEGTVTPGSIMAAITYTTQLLQGVGMLIMLFQNISRGMISWKRLKAVLESEPDLKDGAHDAETDVTGEVEFRNVFFSYPDSDRQVLTGVDLKINKGETVAIMGATGCGKTTLVNLIPRFYDVSEGQILVDGIDVREYKQQALREKIAVALQKSELFSVSVAENISWGIEDAPPELFADPPGQNGADRAAVMEKIADAAKTAQADSFITATPEGYDTLVAERGMSLSGGQKQRVSIARAVARNAEILILDDATSALDLKTEAEFFDALEKTAPDTTKIIVAQRIATVRRADRIYVLENGKIAAAGTHEELLRQSGIYRDIYDSQLGGEATVNG